MPTVRFHYRRRVLQARMVGRARATPRSCFGRNRGRLADRGADARTKPPQARDQTGPAHLARVPATALGSRIALVGGGTAKSIRLSGFGQLRSLNPVAPSLGVKAKSTSRWPRSQSR